MTGMTQKPPLLLLIQRIPFPPHKGDKIRGYNIVRHFAKSYDVYLGTCMDDPADAEHIETVRAMVTELHVEQISSFTGWSQAALRWLGGYPLSFGFFRHSALDRWVADVMERVQPEVAFCCSSNIMPPLQRSLRRPRIIVGDFADVDSQKWRDYAPTKSLATRWIYQAEARRTHKLEAQLAEMSSSVVFVTQEEADLFGKLHPHLAGKTSCISMGVDLDGFSPDIAFPKPDGMGKAALIFTGRMDYWPNVDAVTWFTQNVMPELRSKLPEAQFYIVGGAPNAQVQGLTNEPGVVVTGRVADVQPYLQHGLAAVAPMQIARGIQNKVLEAMAMARPTIVTQDALTGVNAPAGKAVLLADAPQQWVEAVLGIASDSSRAVALGVAGRAFVEAEFGWPAKLAAMDALLR
jgi:sugar transferase (PEP-CTERM/EpsH1 system associated)